MDTSKATSGTIIDTVEKEKKEANVMFKLDKKNDGNQSIILDNYWLIIRFEKKEKSKVWYCLHQTNQENEGRWLCY